MNTIFMNSENSETSDSHSLLLNMSDKWNVKRSHKYAWSSCSIYYTWEIVKVIQKRIDLKYQLQHAMTNLNYLMNQVLYKTLKIIWVFYQKTWKSDSQSSNKNICN